MMTKILKRLVIGICVMAAIFGMYTFGMDKKVPNEPNKIYDVTNFENIKYKVKFEDKAVVINNVKYYIVNYDSLIDNIKKAERKDFEETQTIVSDYFIEKDGTNDKYDIYYHDKSEGSTTIVFYKFKDELDDRFDMPAFAIDQIKSLLIKDGRWK